MPEQPTERDIKNYKNEAKTAYERPQEGKLDKAIERAHQTINRRNESTR